MMHNIPLFSALSSEDLETIKSITIKKTLPRNTIIINEGDVSNSLFIVLKGKAKAVSNNEEGKEIILNLFRPYDYFGEMSFFDGESRCASIVTQEPTQILIIPGDTAFTLIFFGPNSFDILFVKVSTPPLAVE